MKILLSVFLIFNVAFGVEAPSQERVCRDLLNYVYKEITLKNMRLSLERVNKKMMLAFIQALKNSDEQGAALGSDKELLSLFESMSEIDPDFESYLQANRPYRNYEFWSFLPWSSSPDSISYQKILGKWMELQKSRPSLFKGLEERYLLDDWDIKTGQLLEGYSSLQISNDQLRDDISRLASRYSQNYQDIVGSKGADYRKSIEDTKKDIDQLHLSFNNSAKELFWQSMDDFEGYCSPEMINQIIGRDSLSCPFVAEESAPLTLHKTLRDIGSIIDSDFLSENDRAPERPATEPPKPKNDLKIHEYDYKNINYDGNFCERDPKLADTAIIHHSGTSNRDTPQELHDTQIVMHENDRDSAGNPDPWYMIAYNYVVKAPYAGQAGTPTVYSGRPDHIKGAHAGAYVNLTQVDPKVRSLVQQADIKCGWNTDKDKEHSLDRVSQSATRLTKSQIRNGYVSANITSVGILVVGNYAPDILSGRANPGGYRRGGGVRYPTDDALRTSAKLICKLKNEKYPNLRKISDHNYIKIKRDMANGSRSVGTCCPGTVYKRMNRLLELTKEECPEHNFALDISPEDRICSFLKAL